MCRQVREPYALVQTQNTCVHTNHLRPHTKHIQTNTYVTWTIKGANKIKRKHTHIRYPTVSEGIGEASTDEEIAEEVWEEDEESGVQKAKEEEEAAARGGGG